AYTAVDKAETEKETAIAINAIAVGHLAALCKQYNARFIHFSTDYVFSGNADKPYEPTDTTDPVNYYGLTKLMGEQQAFENNEETIVIRTSWVYSSFGKNFVKTMLRLMAEKDAIGVVSDQVGCPTYAADLANAVMQIVQSNNTEAGIYHYCNKGIISWFDFATAIKEIADSNCIVNPIQTKDYPTPAKRPGYSALDTQKIQDKFSIEIPHWRQSLERCIKLM
ncbi:MAG: dTDP-4-dehydrorhamnose reductase, partial [Sphingobacteriales bacterium]